MSPQVKLIDAIENLLEALKNIDTSYNSPEHVAELGRAEDQARELLKEETDVNHPKNKAFMEAATK